jgi:sugar O-acyltransferase (sialic acid O-acetyltransferase NeuD family)
MKRPTLLLIGAGGHAVSCIDTIEQEGRFEIVGLTGLPREVGAKLLGYPVLGTDEELPALCDVAEHAAIAVGQIKTPDLRIRLFERATRLGFAMPTVISPRAYVSPHARLGAGTMVMHGATVNAGATVGQNCIVNSLCLLEHGVKVEDHCHIATATVINGDATVGAGTFVGSRTVVRESVSIGKRCLIGMGQTIYKNCPDGCRIPAAGGGA